MDPLQRSLLSDLLAAVSAGDVDQVRILLARGIPVDVEDHASGWSALHAAVVGGRVEVLELLLQHCENPDRPQKGGATPLAYVIHELGDLNSGQSTERPGHRERLVKSLHILLRAGADPTCGAPGQKALELARLYRLPDIESLLAQIRS